MEGPHRKLRAGLSDRLGRYDSDSLAQLDHPAARQVSSVALYANAPGRPACEHGPYLYPVNLCLVYFFVSVNEDLFAERLEHFLEGDSSEYPLADRLDYLAAFNKGAHVDAVQCAAVLLSYDSVLSDIDKPPGEVTGVGGLQGRVGQTLPGSVSRYEVLENRQALPEVSRNRRFDDLARRLCHQAPHSGQLSYLLRGTPGAGVGHDEYGVEARRPSLSAVLVRDGVGRKLSEHFLGYLFRGLRPDVYDLVVALAVGYETLVVLLLYLLDLFIGRVKQHALAGRYLNVIDTDRDAGLGRVLVAKVLQSVREYYGLLGARAPVADVYKVGKTLLVHDLVYFLELDRGRKYLLDDDPSDFRFN